MKLKLKLQLINNMGLRYVAYRIKYEVEKRFGFLERRIPFSKEIHNYILLNEWKKIKNFFFEDAIPNSKLDVLANSEILKKNFNNLMDCKIQFFNYEWKELGRNYDWVTNPDNGFKYDIKTHWSRINDFDEKSGDIKYVWEKSRFTHFLTIIRNDAHFDQDHSEYIFAEIESWIDSNPINMGPNWRCSQEISLRLFNWSFALGYYKNSKYLTERLWGKIQNTIYWSLHHVYHNIDFSRIAVRNNHAITETLMLSLCNYMFPFIPETKKWAADGRGWFEKEIAYQIYDDGTFLQFSMNYHRVVIQLISLGISISEYFNGPFKDIVYQKAYKSLNFLYQCLQEENGNLPNYGSNDGALFFPFTDSDYRDFRPQLNTLHKILTGADLYPDLPNIMEDAFWVLKKASAIKNFMTPLKKKFGPQSFPIGGYYILREDRCFTFIRCGNHKDRPAHADNLHLDIWIDGSNVIMDSGTYKYNTEVKYQEYFTGSSGHNTVMVGKNSQMLKGSRFIWFFWTQSKNATWTEDEKAYIFEGTIKAFNFLNPKATHTRKIIKSKNDTLWIVKDMLENIESKDNFQTWHLGYPIPKFSAFSRKEIIEPINWPSYSSSYYGQKKEGLGNAFKFEKEITTTIKI